MFNMQWFEAKLIKFGLCKHALNPSGFFFRRNICELTLKIIIFIT